MPRRIVNTEMTGHVPGPCGARGGDDIKQPGSLPIRILDATSAGVRAPKSTQVMRENRVPKVRMGLSRRGD